MAIRRMDDEADSLELRLMGLEREKVRLQGMVTELLFKNQELRRSLAQATVPAGGRESLALEESWR